MCSVEHQPVFRDLSAEDPDPEVTEIESFCVNCHANGITRLLLTRIPYYKNVVLMSFSCEECGFENNEIQPGGAFAEFGVKWKLRVSTAEDLNRQVVRSDYCSVTIPELEFEIPAQSQKGEITTVEGIVSRAVQGLLQDQDTRRQQHPEAAEQIQQFVTRLAALREPGHTWTLCLRDISGNSFIENPIAPRRDPRCDKENFKRSKEENHILGIFTKDEVSDEPTTNGVGSGPGAFFAEVSPDQCPLEAIAGDEVMQFNTDCPACGAPANTNMKLTNIPHFKEVVIMATVCDQCGYRTNEIKSGGGVEAQGVRYEVRVAGREDFARDVIKSETCSMEIPELELEVGGRALGGRASTAEGLLRAAGAQLREAATGDAPGGSRLHEFLAKLDEVLEGGRAVTLVLDDPAGNSYVQSLHPDPGLPDDGLKITRYERSFDQNEELGLNDMKTEGYEQT